MKNRRLRIWIDISNTPHVLFFEPIVRELERRGHAVVLTSRRFANTQDLLRARGIQARRIGSGHDASRNELRKQISHHLRSVRLAAFARAGFDVAVSHLSFTQAAAARRLGIPIFGAIDYEYRDLMVFRHADCLMVPAVIPTGAFGRWGIPERAVRPYDGLKEHVYLDGFKPLPDVRARLGIDARQLLVTFRPIADHATYNDDSGDGLQRRLLEALAAEPGVSVLVLPRTARQRRELEDVTRRLPAVRLVRQAIDGPSLVCASDLVVCGGGTMLREAAVLGVPAVSIFSGPLGAVDRWLASEGRVTLVRSDDDLRRIRVERRPPRVRPPAGNGVLSQIVQGICDTAAPR